MRVKQHAKFLKDIYIFKSSYNNTYLLAYYMVQSPSWEGTPKVHYRTHKCPPTVSILGQPNPANVPTSNLLEIHPIIIIYPSIPTSPQWSPSLRFPHQDPTHTPLLIHMRHMSNPSHSSRFFHPHNIGWGVQII